MVSLVRAVPFKQAQWPGLEPRERRISQGHDSAGALVVDGKIAAAAAQQRFNCKKRAGDFPNRNALPSPSAPGKHLSHTALERPANELESLIAQLWKDAWGVDRLGVNEDFFDLGAHSLMVAEGHAQLQHLLGRDFSLVDLFQFPTVFALAHHLDGQQETPPLSSRAEGRGTAQQRRAQPR